MNKFCWYILFLGLLSCDSSGITQIHISKSIINIGDVVIGTEGKAFFYIKNTGNNDLLIKDISPDCYCTVPEWDRKAVAQGDSVKVTIAIKKEYEGIFQQVAKVKLNTKEQLLLLVVRGKFVKRNTLR